MKRSVSHVAMALALTFGVAGTVGVAAPAYAQKQPKMEISEAFQPHAVAIQESVNGVAENPAVKTASDQAMTATNAVLNARDDAARASAQSQLDAARAQVDQQMGGILAKLEAGRPTLTTPDDKLFFGQMELNVGQQMADFEMQNDGIDMMIASGKIPAEELPKYHYFAGQTAYNAQNYGDAAASLQQAIDGGYTQNDAEKLLVDAYLRNEQTAEGLAKLKSMIEARQAAGQPVPEGWAFDGLAASVNQGQRDQAFDWGMMTLQTDSRTQARQQAYKIVEAYSPTYSDEEQLDLLRLMARDGGITDDRQALTYIELMQPMRRPGEAKTFTDSGAKMPAGNTMVTEAKRVGSERYDSTLRELNADASGASGNAALAIADTYLGYGKAAEAEAMYRKALETGATDKAKAQMGLGIALADQDKMAEAKQAFGQISGGNRASLAQAWIAYTDMKSS
ncbi:MAG: hypothetical protein CL820_01200 [Croceicoccus sp.]|nr:hypothetical protein [Croceicoccus sp.]MAL24506.1 hypothetical protein [Croceicoccus sp.]|tara:strand:+ start:18758 stop:20113 length:1356 start_codon:yes stop_codon:yes gene_type:complete